MPAPCRSRFRGLCASCMLHRRGHEVVLQAGVDRIAFGSVEGRLLSSLCLLHSHISFCSRLLSALQCNFVNSTRTMTLRR